jgi:chemotaxis family two-component system response regulator Rcp1
MPNRANPIEILLVEDNPADARMTVEALRDANVRNRVRVITDGEQAFDYLRQGDSASPPSHPDLILLDLDLPKMDGRELLKAIKADERLRDIPVVILTSSRNTQDITSAYHQQVSCFIQKPLDLDDYFEAIRSLKQLWFHVATLPRVAAVSN